MIPITHGTGTPLWAPIVLPRITTSAGSPPRLSGSAGSHLRYLSASTTVSPTTYTVGMFLTHSPQSVNNPPGFGPDEADWYASFGAQLFPSAHAAQAQLASRPVASCAGMLGPDRPTPKTTTVAVDGSTLKSCRTGTRTGDYLFWTEGEWQFSAGSNSVGETQMLATDILTFTRKFLLPAEPGTFSVGQGDDPGTSQVSWRVGRVVLGIQGTAGAVSTIGQMASKLRPYPVG